MDLTVKEIFEVATGKKQGFGVPGYAAPNKYEDPLR